LAVVQRYRLGCAVEELSLALDTPGRLVLAKPGAQPRPLSMQRIDTSLCLLACIKCALPGLRLGAPLGQFLFDDPKPLLRCLHRRGLHLRIRLIGCLHCVDGSAWPRRCRRRKRDQRLACSGEEPTFCIAILYAPLSREPLKEPNRSQRDAVRISEIDGLSASKRGLGSTSRLLALLFFFLAQTLKNRDERRAFLGQSRYLGAGVLTGITRLMLV